jgi:hypothetical protein
MTRILKARRAAILAATFTTLAFGACGDPAMGPEEAVRDWVARGQQAAEHKDRGELIDMVSPAYADARGNNRGDLENMLRVIFLRQKTIALLVRVEELTVYDDSAAQLVLQVGGVGSNENLLGFSADAYRFEMELERDGDEWLLISARWAALGEQLR